MILFRYIYLGMIIISLNACISEKTAYDVADKNVLLEGKVVYTHGFSERYYSIDLGKKESVPLNLPKKQGGTYHFAYTAENNIIVYKQKEEKQYFLIYYDFNSLRTIKSIIIDNCVKNTEFFVEIINGIPYAHAFTPNNRSSRYYCNTTENRIIHYNYRCRFVSTKLSRLCAFL